MAIASTGSVSDFSPSNNNAGTVSTAITVPADAELILVGVSGYAPTDNFFSAGSMTFTKGGVDTAMTAATLNGDADSTGNFFMCTMFYMVLPDTGINKTLKWDWAGTSTTFNGPLVSITFWKGVDTASPVRDADGAQAGGMPITTPTLTAQTDDLIVAFVGVFCTAEGAASTWSNLTTFSQCTIATGQADGAWGTGSPSGNTTVGITAFSNETDGGIVAVVLQPAAAGDVTNLVPQTWM